MRGCAVWALAACLLLVGCGESDEDKLEAFAQAVTGDLNVQRLDHVMQTYVDPAQQPLVVTVFNDPREYGSDTAATIGATARERLARIMGSTARVMRKRIRIDGKQATVTLQLFGERLMGHTRYELEKHGDSWLVKSLDVSR